VERRELRGNHHGTFWSPAERRAQPLRVKRDGERPPGETGTNQTRMKKEGKRKDRSVAEQEETQKENLKKEGERAPAIREKKRENQREKGERLKTNSPHGSMGSIERGWRAMLERHRVSS